MGEKAKTISGRNVDAEKLQFDKKSDTFGGAIKSGGWTRSYQTSAVKLLELKKGMRISVIAPHADDEILGNASIFEIVSRNNFPRQIRYPVGDQIEHARQYDKDIVSLEDLQPNDPRYMHLHVTYLFDGGAGVERKDISYLTDLSEKELREELEIRNQIKATEIEKLSKFAGFTYLRLKLDKDVPDFYITPSQMIVDKLVEDLIKQKPDLISIPMVTEGHAGHELTNICAWKAIEKYIKETRKIPKVIENIVWGGYLGFNRYLPLNIGFKRELVSFYHSQTAKFTRSEHAYDKMTAAIAALTAAFVTSASRRFPSWQPELYTRGDEVRQEQKYPFINLQYAEPFLEITKVPLRIETGAESASLEALMSKGYTDNGIRRIASAESYKAQFAELSCPENLKDGRPVPSIVKNLMVYQLSFP